MSSTAVRLAPPWFELVATTALVVATGYALFVDNRGFVASSAGLQLVDLLPDDREAIRLTSCDAPRRLGLTILELRPNASEVPTAADYHLEPRTTPTYGFNPSPARGGEASATVFAIPTTAVIETGDGPTVFVARGPNYLHFHRVPITVHRTAGGIVQFEGRVEIDGRSTTIGYGDRIVGVGAVGLYAEMINLRATRSVDR